mmetsp:Transcript_6508/g.12195  ORF Transcript_6508/g.12195 Transcript_6508/m.12195 type:complete len:216 (+) Transcript_6508:1893-2540(+)
MVAPQSPHSLHLCFSPRRTSLVKSQMRVPFARILICLYLIAPLLSCCRTTSGDQAAQRWCTTWIALALLAAFLKFLPLCGLGLADLGGSGHCIQSASFSESGSDVSRALLPSLLVALAAHLQVHLLSSLPQHVAMGGPSSSVIRAASTDTLSFSNTTWWHSAHSHAGGWFWLGGAGRAGPGGRGAGLSERGNVSRSEASSRNMVSSCLELRAKSF